MNIGCHVSIANGIENAPKLARELGCESAQIFTRSPQGGKTPELTEKTIQVFKENCEKYDIKNVYIHAPYFINLGSANNKIYYNSIRVIKTELERAGALGAKFVMTHLGSTKDLGEEESVKKTTEGLEKILGGYNGSARLLVENSAGAGSPALTSQDGVGRGKIIGADFEQIGRILRAIKNPSLAGICLDTQHSFASGYDWKNNFDNCIKALDKNIGIKNIRLIHANDSASEIGSHIDRHAHIGQGSPALTSQGGVGRGKIGLVAFAKIANFAQNNDIDMICETTYPGVIEDIKILKEMRKNFVNLPH